MNCRVCQTFASGKTFVAIVGIGERAVREGLISVSPAYPLLSEVRFMNMQKKIILVVYHSQGGTTEHDLAALAELGQTLAAGADFGIF